MSKEEFDRKVQENPANDHLKVKVSDIKDNINEGKRNFICLKYPMPISLPV